MVIGTAFTRADVATLAGSAAARPASTVAARLGHVCISPGDRNNTEVPQTARKGAVVVGTGIACASKAALVAAEAAAIGTSSNQNADGLDRAACSVPLDLTVNMSSRMVADVAVQAHAAQTVEFAEAAVQVSLQVHVGEPEQYETISEGFDDAETLDKTTSWASKDALDRGVCTNSAYAQTCNSVSMEFVNATVAMLLLKYNVPKLLTYNPPLLLTYPSTVTKDSLGQVIREKINAAKMDSVAAGTNGGHVCASPGDRSNTELPQTARKLDSVQQQILSKKEAGHLRRDIAAIHLRCRLQMEAIVFLQARPYPSAHHVGLVHEILLRQQRLRRHLM